MKVTGYVGGMSGELVDDTEDGRLVSFVCYARLTPDQITELGQHEGSELPVTLELDFTKPEGGPAV